jgi:hypothetical protein
MGQAAPYSARRLFSSFVVSSKQDVPAAHIKVSPSVFVVTVPLLLGPAQVSAWIAQAALAEMSVALRLPGLASLLCLKQ